MGREDEREAPGADERVTSISNHQPGASHLIYSNHASQAVGKGTGVTTEKRAEPS